MCKDWMRSKWTTSIRSGQIYRDLDIWGMLFQQISRSCKQFVLLYWQVGREGLFVKYLMNYPIEQMHRPGGQAPAVVSVNVWSQGEGGEGCGLASASAVPTFSRFVKLPRFPVAPGKHLHALPSFVTVPGNAVVNRKGTVWKWHFLCQQFSLPSQVCWLQ